MLTYLAERAGPNGASKVDIYALKVFAWNVTDDSLRQPVVPSPSRCALLLMRARTPHSLARVSSSISIVHNTAAAHCARAAAPREMERGGERESGKEEEGEEECAADRHPQRKACA